MKLKIPTQIGQQSDVFLIVNWRKVIMAKADGSIMTPAGKVYYKYRPTDYDKEGCQGLYVENVELKPIREWPLWFLMLVVIRCIPKLFMRLARWILIERHKNRKAAKNKNEDWILKNIPKIIVGSF